MMPTQQIGNATISAALDGGPGQRHAARERRRPTGSPGGAGDDVLDAAGATLVRGSSGGRGADRLIGRSHDANAARRE